MVLNFDKKVVSLNIIYFYTLHIVLLYKGNKTVWMFYEKFLTRETTLCSPNINDIDRDYKVSPGLQPLTTGSVLKICGVFSVRLCICIFYTGNYLVIYYKTKQILNIFE